MEQWKDIADYEGLYQVSSLGRVKSLKDNKGKKREKILKQYLSNGNYLFVGLRKNNKRKNYRIHKLVANAFISNPLNKPCVNHIDGNKANNNINNLEWVTYSENMKHAFKSGLWSSWNKGKHYHLSEEHKEKISKAHKKRHQKDII